MQVQVHTDNHIDGSEKLTAHVQSVVADALSRFGNRITRVEVQLGDENSRAKGGDDDKRCTVEARLAGMQPTTVTHHAGSIEQALDGVLERLEKTLDRTLGRQDPKGRTSMSGE